MVSITGCAITTARFTTFQSGGGVASFQEATDALAIRSLYAFGYRLAGAATAVGEFGAGMATDCWYAT